MGVAKHKCEQCKTWFYQQGACSDWRGGDDRQKEKFELSGIHEGTYNSRFCCKNCAEEWSAAHPGKSTKTAGTRATLWCFTAPFKLAWWCGKLCWKIAKNKWTWTLCTCGMSWVTWKILDKIYRPKD